LFVHSVHIHSILIYSDDTDGRRIGGGSES